MNETKVFMFNFLNFETKQISGNTFWTLFVCDCFASLYCDYLGATPLLYVQAAILNLSYLYLRCTTCILYVLLDYALLIEWALHDIKDSED